MNEYLPEGCALTSVVNTECISSKAGLQRAAEEGKILEAPAFLADRELNLHVSLGGGMTGIIPKEECVYMKGSEEVKDIAILTRVGKPVCFKVVGFLKNGERECTPLLSRRAAQRECRTCYVDGLIAGDIVPAKITHLEPFGAFADIGCGIVSLLSIDCLSVSRIRHPSDRLSVGERIFAAVKSKDEGGRIFLTERELLGTWEENAAAFREGQTVRGIVRGVESYGVFVELAPNLAGLAESRCDVKVGQTAAVFIKSIIPEKMKIKLVIIDETDEKATKEPLRYFYDFKKVQHLERWVYSPECAEKKIETVFG